jgi:hypothetical protein
MAKAKKKPEPPEWLVAMVEYEGLPLALRVRPQIDTEQNKAAYPRRVRVTHKLAKVQPNGLPEPDYNEALFDLDQAIVAALQTAESGIVVLIETFNGERNYDAYITSSATPAAAIRDLKKRFPKQKITLIEKDDPEWKLYSHYHKLFPWD